MQRTLFTLIVLSICTTSLAADAPKVLIAPFVETGNRPAFPWVGRAIQRALVTELTETGEARPIAAGEHVRLGFDEKHLPAVVEAGKSEGAAYVVVGAFEVTDGRLIVTGKTIKVHDGESAGPLDAVGTLRDLFKVQAEVGEQVKLALAGTPLKTAPQKIATRHAPADDDGGTVVIVTRSTRDDATAAAASGAEEPTLAQPRRDARSSPLHLGNTMGGGSGNSAGGISGNTIGGTGGLSIVNTPGNVISGGSGNIFLSGPGNYARGSGNFIDGGDGNGITQPWFHQIIGGDAHVMQGGDGNYIDGGSGITIQSGPGNTAGGISGNTVGAGAGNSNTGGGNTVRSGAGNTNGR